MTRQDRQTLAGLQVLRAIAALMVAVHHAMEVPRFSPLVPPPDWLTTAGAAGVDIFFVISGFIMMVIAFPQGCKPDNPWSFLRRRVARIYPFYWITAGVVLVGWQLGHFKTFAPTEPAAGDIARSLLLAPSKSLIISVSWTLVHEMNFYLLFALMLWTRNQLACVLGVTGLVLLQLAFAGYASDFALRLFLTRPIALEFCFGLVLGYAYLNGMLPTRIPWTLSAAAFGLIVLAPLFIAHEDTGGLDDERVWAWGIPAVVLVAAGVNWSVGNGVLSRIWVLLGDASYAIYLLHPFVMLAYVKALVFSSVLLHAPQIPLILAATILSAALGVAAHVAIERPISKATRRLLLPEQPTRAVPASAP